MLFLILLGNNMRKFFIRLEQYARYAAMFAALVAALLWSAFQMDWIRSSAHYQISSWYLIDSGKHYFSATEYFDESTCREHLRENQSCKTGSEMVARELADQGQRIAAVRI